MADLRDDIFEYADRLYAKALHEMEAERFRAVDIYALSAYGAAVFLVNDKRTPSEMREQAKQLEHASWNLAKQSRMGQRRKLMEPRLDGPGGRESYDDVRQEMRDIVKTVTR